MKKSFWFVLASSLCACVSSEAARDYGDPTSLSTPTESNGIVAWVESPGLDDALTSATPEIVVGSYTAPHAKPLLVQIGRLEKDELGSEASVDLRPTQVEGKPGKDQRFKLAVPLTHGENRFLVRIETPDRSQVRRLVFALNYQGDAPGLTLSVRAPSKQALLGDDACDDTREIRLAVTNAPRVCVRGSVTTLDESATEVQVGLAGSERKRVQLDAEGRFASELELAPNLRHMLEVELKDAQHRVTKAQMNLVQDARPPTLRVTSLPRETSAPTLDVQGTVSDPFGVDALEIRSADGGVQKVPVGSPWLASVRLSNGENAFEVVARDVAGNEVREPLTLSRSRTLWLGEPSRNVGTTRIELTRTSLEELLTRKDQESIELVAVDLAPAVRNAFERIRTPLRLGVDTSQWGPAEWNLQRILSMTPDTANLRGTSVEELLSIANAVGLPSRRILAELLDIDTTDYVMDPDVAADVLMEQLVGTHPRVKRDAQGHYVMPVSMYDVLQDMRTLATRFGPSGTHPGFLEGSSAAEVLEPGFLLTLPVHSNLEQYDAVDLSRAAKAFLFLLEGDQVLDFNVLTDEFELVGLKDEPTVDLRFSLREHPGPNMLRAGSKREARPDASDPGFYRGSSEGFGVAGWLFERIALEAGYRMYHRAFERNGFHRVLRYHTGSIDNAAVIDWNRGWVVITTAGGIGAPPAPLYAWDLLMEVAQVRLHDKGLAEGDANMAFSLEDLPIGLTGDQLIDKLRPKLAEQEAELSKMLVGDAGLAKSDADLFYVPAKGQDGALLFRAPSDSKDDYAYERPGFYSDLALTKKVSTKAPVGGVAETEHEKVPAKVGATYYAEDDRGSVYEIEIAERDGERIGVRVRNAAEVP